MLSFLEYKTLRKVLFKNTIFFYLNDNYIFLFVKLTYFRKKNLLDSFQKKKIIINKNVLSYFIFVVYFLFVK